MGSGGNDVGAGAPVDGGEEVGPLVAVDVGTTPAGEPSSRTLPPHAATRKKAAETEARRRMRERVARKKKARRGPR